MGTCVSAGGSAYCDCPVGYVNYGATCQPECSDGLVVSDESCDDGNFTGGDGCDSSCHTEQGYVCTGEPSLCSAVCGDGLMVGDEECDDGNASSGDGCDSACVVEPGWECSGSPSVCELPVVIHVDHDSSAASPNGLSWQTAYATVQAGVDEAVSYLQADPERTVEIWVASGTYYPYDYPGNTITLHSGIALFGGFTGSEQQRHERPHYLTAQTVFDGEDLVESIMTGDQAEDVVIDGFVFRNGEGSRGGGLRTEDGSVALRNCTFSDNHADDGGAIYIYDSSVLATNVTFLRNSTGGHGGAVYLAQGGFSATSCVFAENTAGWAGAFGTNISLTLSGSFTNCTFYDNSGMARAIQATYAYLYNCIIWGHGTDNPVMASVTGANNVSEDSDTGDPSVNADPLFSDAANGDFSLLPGSPCIDAADDTRAPELDITDSARYDDPSTPNTDGIADIGAYEYRP